MKALELIVLSATLGFGSAPGVAVAAPSDVVARARASLQPSSSEDDLLKRSVAGYTRAMLDRGGWENPLVTANHYAAGNPLLAVPPGDGVTLVVAEGAPRRLRHVDDVVRGSRRFS